MKKTRRSSSKTIIKHLSNSPYRFYAIGCRDVDLQEAIKILEIILTTKKASDIKNNLKKLYQEND